MSIAMFLAGMAIGYYRGWQLALIITFTIPFMSIAAYGLVWVS